jgi:hypothetical protein
MAVTIFSALLLIGCGKDDDPDNGDGGSLILGEGEAWTGTETGTYTSCYGDEKDGTQHCEEGTYTRAVGYVFKQNDELLRIEKDDSSGIWYGYVTGKWSATGNKIVVTDEDGNVDEITYKISGDTLTITIRYGNRNISMTYKKTSGITNIKNRGE